MSGPVAGGTLIRRGGRVLGHLPFITFYYGAIWSADPAYPDKPQVLARARIDDAIARAASDPGLNAPLAQYCGGPVTAAPYPSVILSDDVRPAPVNQPFNEHDILRVLQLVLPRLPAGFDCRTAAINIVLPEGMTLEVLGVDEAQRPPGAPVQPGVPRDRMNCDPGIAGYHGSMQVTGAAGTPVEVLYSVVAWSNGSTGIVVSGWDGAERITATLYHELQEIRTNPDVDLAVRSGNAALIGWNTDPIQGPGGVDCREIADLALIQKGSAAIRQAFAKVPVAGGDPVPIQLLWSNSDGCLVPQVAG